jgi:hypothetical protein
MTLTQLMEMLLALNQERSSALWMAKLLLVEELVMLFARWLLLY